MAGMLILPVMLIPMILLMPVRMIPKRLPLLSVFR